MGPRWGGKSVGLCFKLWKGVAESWLIEWDLCHQLNGVFFWVWNKIASLCCQVGLMEEFRSGFGEPMLFVRSTCRLCFTVFCVFSITMLAICKKFHYNKILTVDDWSTLNLGWSFCWWMWQIFRSFSQRDFLQLPILGHLHGTCFKILIAQ